MSIVKFLVALLIANITECLNREQLLEHIREKQETRNTFDARVHRPVQPIGSINGEPIWPRVLQSVQSEAELFLDDDNFAYRVSPYRDAASLIRRMDKQENYDKVMNFLEKYIRE